MNSGKKFLSKNYQSRLLCEVLTFSTKFSTKNAVEKLKSTYFPQNFFSGTNPDLSYSKVTIIQSVEKMFLTNRKIMFKGEAMRGVNKIVVEVRPEGEYFEKALLFIRPGKNNVPQKEISDNAEKLLNDIQQNKVYNKSNIMRTILLIFSGAAAGSLISWTISFIIFIL